MQEKILVVGASGLVGQSLVNFLDANNYKVVGGIKDCHNNLPVEKVQLDLSNPDEVETVVSSEKPDIIVNVAGLIGFGKCDTDPEKAVKLNTEGVQYLVQSASSYNPLFIQFSTDAVFDGNRGFYSETDIPNPTSIYGKTKLAGDEIVLSSSLHSMIIRPSVVYGTYKYKQKDIRFIDSVLESLIKGRSFDAMVDTFNSPTFLDDLCEGLIFLINQGVNGMFHLAGDERLSKYDFALRIAHQFGLDSTKIRPVESKSVPNLLLYPKDTSLDVSKIKQEGYTPCDVNEGLKRYAQQREFQALNVCS